MVLGTIGVILLLIALLGLFAFLTARRELRRLCDQIRRRCFSLTSRE